MLQVQLPTTSDAQAIEGIWRLLKSLTEIIEDDSLALSTKDCLKMTSTLVRSQLPPLVNNSKSPQSSFMEWVDGNGDQEPVLSAEALEGTVMERTSRQGLSSLSLLLEAVQERDSEPP